jgi:hypothetical protein
MILSRYSPDLPPEFVREMEEILAEGVEEAQERDV